MNNRKVKLSDTEDLKRYLSARKTVTESELNTLLNGRDDDCTNEILLFIHSDISKMILIDDMCNAVEEEDYEEPSLTEVLYDINPDIDPAEIEQIKDLNLSHDDLVLYCRDIEREEEKIRLRYDFKPDRVPTEKKIFSVLDTVKIDRQYSSDK